MKIVSLFINLINNRVLNTLQDVVNSSCGISIRHLFSMLYKEYNHSKRSVDSPSEELERTV